MRPFATTTWTRTFTHSYDVANGTYTHTGPDGAVTTVQQDTANRVQSVQRQAPNGGPVLMTGTYSYYDNDLVQSVTYGNGASTWYTYDAARRITRIEHRAPGGAVMLAIDYAYYLNDLPQTITESGATVTTPTITSFTYDHRSRLTDEYRIGQNGYHRAYVYDAGGNRLSMTDDLTHRRVVYHYDVDEDVNPPQVPTNPYGSFNNRLEWSETFDISSGVPPYPLVSKTWYYYNMAGNVTSVVTSDGVCGGGAQNMAAGVFDPAASSPSPSQGEGWGEGGWIGAADLPVGGESMVASRPGRGGGAAGTRYSATTFNYAHNGRTVTHVLGETWCWQAGYTCEQGGSYTRDYLREFRYDGARARYMNRELNPWTFTETATTWSDYDGNEIHGDFTVANGVAADSGSYQPGLWRRLKVGTNFVPEYLHSDHLGTLRLTTNTSGNAGASRVFTAFGERMAGPPDRFGYLGEDGVQADAGFPFLLIDGRFYGPSSGAYLQRDVGGTPDSLNVYAFGATGLITIVPPMVLGSTNNPGGAAGNTPAGAREVIETVRDMGKFAGDVNKPTGYTKHAINQAISREGRGVAVRAIAEALKAGWTKLPNGTLKFVGKYATLIMREDGTIITLWATCTQGVRTP